MKKILLGAYATFSLFASIAQTCGERYKDQIFSSVTVTTRTYSTTNKAMDIYTPDGDTASSRPVIFWVHGGTFISGTKSDADVVDLATRFAKRGYVTVSIDYSLASNPLLMTDSVNAYPIVMKAVMEAKAAVRFLRLDCNVAAFGIDPSTVFFGGSSAGAVLAVNYAFLDTTAKATPLLLSSLVPYIDVATYGDTLEGNLGNPGPSSHLQGVIDLAGGVMNTAWIDGHTNIPMVLCQGTADHTVPYTCDRVLSGGSNIVLCGSSAMAPALDAASIPYVRYDFQGSGHCPWDTEADTMNVVDTFTANFLWNYVPHSTACIVDTQLPAPTDCTSGIAAVENEKMLNVYPNPAQNLLNISVENNAAEIKTIRIFNVLGQTAYSGNETKITTTAMQNGVYFVEVTFKNNERAVKRVEILK